MGISKLKFHNFRNFKEKLIPFSEQVVNIIIGPNASGKSNILEGLFLLSTGKSFKAGVEEEIVKYDEEIARVQGLVGDTKLEVVLTRGLITVGQYPTKTEKVARKRLLVNKIPRRLVDFSGNFKTVLFGPWDLDLVTSSPSLRRRALDMILSQIDREYRRAILSYEKGLRQRNRLLFRIREEGLPRSHLLFWNNLLIKNGDYISKKREEFMNFANSLPSVNEQIFTLEYDKSAISEGRLEQYKEEEVFAATTLVGPHRDDMIFKIGQLGKNRNLDRFGSRGEQRMGVLWFKLAELAYIEQQTEGRPTLLLDDIFSELDREHRKIVMNIIGKQQTIITTADPHFIADLKTVEKISLKD